MKEQLKQLLMQGVRPSEILEELPSATRADFVEAANELSKEVGAVFAGIENANETPDGLPLLYGFNVVKRAIEINSEKIGYYDYDPMDNGSDLTLRKAIGVTEIQFLK